MKALITILALTLSAALAKADGFVCHTDSGLNIKIYNHTEADLGTRNAAVMIISDENVGYGNKTIAKFTDVNQTLGREAGTYTANVDLRFNDSNRKGELIAGTKLGEVKYIVLDIDFTYASGGHRGDLYDGKLTLVKRNGEAIDEDIDRGCERYLKGE